MRNLASRIVKLETRRRHDDEILVIWCKPTGDFKAAIEAERSRFVAGDRVILAPWYGDDAPPAARWTRNLPKNLSKREKDYLDRWFRERCEEWTARDPNWGKERIAPMPELTDADLWYEMLRIDGPIRMAEGFLWRG